MKKAFIALAILSILVILLIGIVGTFILMFSNQYNLFTISCNIVTIVGILTLVFIGIYTSL